MADKFIYIDSNGKKAEKEFKQTSAGAGDAGKGVALNEAGEIDGSMLPNVDVKSIVASEALSAGDFVNLWDDSGTLKMRKADASNDRPAHGFVKSAVSSAASGNCYFEGTNTGLSGLTKGVTYFLSNSGAGGVTATAVTTTGHILQVVGVALSATEINFEPGEPVTRA